MMTDDLLYVAIRVVSKLNHVAESEFNCPLFYIEYMPGYSIGICSSEYVVWNSDSEKHDNCDGSEFSIMSYINSKLEILGEELRILIRKYPSLSKEMSS